MGGSIVDDSTAPELSRQRNNSVPFIGSALAVVGSVTERSRNLAESVSLSSPPFSRGGLSLDNPVVDNVARSVALSLAWVTAFQSAATVLKSNDFNLLEEVRDTRL